MALKPLKVFFISLPIIGLALSLLFLSREGRKKEAKAPVVFPNVAEEITLTGFGSGGKKFVLEGKTISMEGMKFGPFLIGPDTKAHVEGARVTFLKDNQPVSILTARQAEADKKELSGYKRISFSGDITLITRDSRTLTCDSLVWDNKNSLLLAEGSCVLRYEGKAAKADFIRTDAELKNFTIEKKDRALLFSKKGEGK